ncbi:alpha/beta hydrolase [Micromonospora polyrhachis]|uniref:Pimeloyl-ACP methyl ester carboxylesterase n=1 Tax=Micromonospora polyrhachis TaxID=1282883 RepID=A0A7W7WQG8_9ACTN|nr:alpha/beta fold hydrolase [Micromonospora polyrhachis]MBB4959283.1 pimeloyl-ACP methyl ester carboxylesterase [Micromonospora polyrhachis]
MDVEAGGGLPVVFVHGIRVSGTMWQPLTRVVERHHPSAAPDLPGHGRRRGERFTIEAAVEGVADTIDQLGGRALVVGLSLGGYVGIATAARYPERVAGLVAIGCTARPVGTFAALFRQVAWLAGRYPEVANRLSARTFRRALPEPLAEAMVVGGLSCEVLPQVVDEVTRLDVLRELSTYQGRVCLVNGARDHFRADERRFLDACPDGRLVVLARRGHLDCLVEVEFLAGIVTEQAGMTTLA